MRHISLAVAASNVSPVRRAKAVLRRIILLNEVDGAWLVTPGPRHNVLRLVHLLLLTLVEACPLGRKQPDPTALIVSWSWDAT